MKSNKKINKMATKKFGDKETVSAILEKNIVESLEEAKNIDEVKKVLTGKNFTMIISIKSIDNIGVYKASVFKLLLENSKDFDYNDSNYKIITDYIDKFYKQFDTMHGNLKETENAELALNTDLGTSALEVDLNSIYPDLSNEQELILMKHLLMKGNQYRKKEYKETKIIINVKQDDSTRPIYVYFPTNADSNVTSETPTYSRILNRLAIPWANKAMDYVREGKYDDAIKMIPALGLSAGIHYFVKEDIESEIKFDIKNIRSVFMVGIPKVKPQIEFNMKPIDVCIFMTFGFCIDLVNLYRNKDTVEKGLVKFHFTNDIYSRIVQIKANIETKQILNFLETFVPKCLRKIQLKTTMPDEILNLLISYGEQITQIISIEGFSPKNLVIDNDLIHKINNSLKLSSTNTKGKK